MSPKDESPKANRRQFLGGVIAAGAATASAITPRISNAADAPAAGEHNHAEHERAPAALPPNGQTIAAETMGMFKFISRVRRVAVSTWEGMTSERPGSSKTSSKVSPSRISMRSLRFAGRV